MKLLNKISASSALLSLLVAQMNQGAFAQVRFEKFSFKEGVDDDKTIGFPLSASDATFLRENSNSDSVMLPSEGCSGVSFTELKESLEEKGVYPPPHPEDKSFWGELREVAYAVGQLKEYQKNKGSIADPLPKVMPRVTHLWNGKLDIVEVAEAVRDEFPGVYHRELITEWLGAGSLNRDSTLFQTKNPNIDFLRFQIMLSDMTGHAIRMVGPCDFSLKWDVGRARPEEVAWKIQNKELEAPVTVAKDDDDLLNVIEEIDFKSATEFTAYASGSPNHPSYPAMHSAASAGSFWLDVLMDLTEEQLCEARMLDYSISYARTVAGVHYASDNIAGLMVGQEILAQKLPQYLHDEYGADYTVVKEAVKEARYDWTDFEKSDCWNKNEFEKYRTVAKGEILNGQAVKCSASEGTVYRYTNEKLRGYPNPSIATSWDSNWRSFVVINCNGIPKGPAMGILKSD